MLADSSDRDDRASRLQKSKDGLHIGDNSHSLAEPAMIVDSRGVAVRVGHARKIRAIVIVADIMRERVGGRLYEVEMMMGENKERFVVDCCCNCSANPVLHVQFPISWRTPSEACLLRLSCQSLQILHAAGNPHL